MMAHSIPWKLLVSLLISASQIVQGSIHHTTTQIYNSTRHEIYRMVNKQAEDYKMYLMASVILGATKNKSLTNEVMILNIDRFAFDADDIVYSSNNHQNQMTGNVVKFEYVNEFEAENTPYIQRDNRAYSKSITLNYFSQSFQRSLANAYLKNIYAYRYRLFSQKNLNADSFEKNGLKLKQTDNVELNDGLDNYNVIPVKHFQLEIFNREIFFNSDVGKKLMQPPLVIQLAWALRAANTINSHPKILDVSNKRYVDILAHEILQIINNNETKFEAKLSTRFLNGDSLLLSAYAMAIRDTLFPGMNIGQIEPGSNFLIDKTFLVSHFIALECEKNYGKPLSTSATDANSKALMSIKPETIVEFMENLTLSIYVTDLDGAQNLCRTVFTGILPDLYRPFLLQYTLQNLFEEMKSASEVYAAKIKNYLVDSHWALSMLIRKPSSGNNLIFCVGDSSSLEEYLMDFTGQSNSHNSIPVALFNTWNMTYACDQVLQILDQSHAPDLYFISLVDISIQSEFLEAALTMPEVGLPRTICVLISRSDSVTLKMKPEFQKELEVLEKLIEQKNYANARIIFIIEEHIDNDNVGSRSQILLTMVNATIFAGPSKPRYLIEDGPYKLKKTSLNAALNIPVQLNGQTITIGELFSPISPESQELSLGKHIWFQTGKKDSVITESSPDPATFLSGEVYIYRQLVPWPNSKVMPLAITTDTPTTIANDIAISSTPSSERKIIAINGESGSGKTVILQKIQYELQSMSPSTWSIFIDLPQLLPPRRSEETMTVDKIVEEVVDSKFHDLFWNLVKVNPRKILFLLDGVDELESDRELSVLNISVNLFQLGIHVVLTGNFRTVELLLNKPSLTVDIYDIRELSFRDTRELLSCIWYEPFNNKTLNISDTSNNYLINYVDEFSAKLFHSVRYTITPLALVMIAEIFRKHCINHIQKKFDKFQLPDDTFNQIGEMNDLYEKYIDTISQSIYNIQNFQRVYSTRAFLQIFESVDNLGKESPLLRPVLNEIVDAEMQYTASTSSLNSPRASTSRDHVHRNVNHKDIKEFYATKYIERLLSTTGTDSSLYLLESLLKNPAYSNLMHYLDLNINNIAEKLILFETSVFFPDHRCKELRPTLKHLINIKCANLHNFIFHTLPRATQVGLRDFYINEEIEFYKPMQTFGQLSLREYAQLDIHEMQPTKISCTLMCKLVENSMLISLESLRGLNIWYDSNSPKHTEYYNNMLDIAVTRPIPNRFVLEFLMENLPTPEFTPDYNSLLLRTVSETGDGCQSIANYLVTLGANPQLAQTSDGRTLLHAAVKWQNLDLLEYVVKDLKVNKETTATNSQMSVFAAALDANPCPFYTAPNWWKVMDYLVHNVAGVTEQRITDQPSTSRAEPASVRLFKAISANLYSPNFYIFSRHAVLNTLFDNKLERLIRYATWNMHPETSALRRRILTNKILAEYGLTQVSPLALLLHYQGSLPTQDRLYYEKTVFDMLMNAFKISDNKLRTPLIKMLIKNVYNADDLNSLKFFVNAGVAFSPEERKMMISLLDQHLSSTSRTMSSPGMQSSTSLLSSIDFLLRNQPISPMIQNTAHGEIQYDSLMHTLLESASTSAPVTDSSITTIERCLTQPSSSCGVSWESIDEFNDASDRRSIRQIRINSGRFLVVLARAQNLGRLRTLNQLLEFGRNLLNLPQGMRFFTGNSRMVLREILYYPSFNSYSSSLITSRVTNDIFAPISTIIASEARENLGMSISNYGADADGTHAISDSELDPTPRKSSYTTVANALSIVTFIRHLHAAVAMCATAISSNQDKKGCIISSSSLAKFTLVDFIGPQLVAYMPLILAYYSHSLVHYLPANMRHFFLDCFGSNGLCSPRRTGKIIKYGLGTVGALFDLYIIADSAKSLLECKETPSCTSKILFDLIIALGFSSMSLGVSVASMIIKGGQLTYPFLGLGLLLLESIVLTGNTILWYSSNYHTNFLENVRICLYNFLFIGIPSDILALQARTDRINDLQKQMVQFLNDSDSHIVAYATGVGRLTNSIWAPGESTVNMLHSDIKNTHGLSRVLPGSIAGITPLCLPKKDSSESYETEASETVSSSVYACENALVIADTKKWASITRDSIMIYDLLHVNRGYISGSNIVNNYFIIWKGQETFHIVAHTNEVSNVFLFQDSQFHGRISLIGAPNYQTIFDLSNLQDIITVTWKKIDRKVSVQIGRKSHDHFTIAKTDSAHPHFLFIGRSNRKDIYNCDYHNNYEENIHNRSITVNGAGGNELPSQYDDITDCQTTVVQPWTIIRGSLDSETVYSSYVYLDHPPTTNQSVSIAHIIPKKSQFFIVFSGSQFVLAKTINVTYSARNDTLIWHFWHTNSTQMKLYVESFLTVSYPDKMANITLNDVFSKSQTTFFDYYTNATVYPVIKLPNSSSNVTVVKHFYLIVSILTTKFVDIYSYYNQKFSPKVSIGNLSYDVNFFYAVTKENFIFGSNRNGRYLIEARTALVAGNGGKDIYVYSNLSPQTVYIDNYSSDRITDTLIIVNNTCGLLTSVHRMQQSLHSVNDLGNYLLLQCSDSLHEPSYVKYIVVLKYFDRMEWRHLQILWNDKVFVPLPPNWSGGKLMILDPLSFLAIPKLALYFSFDDDWNGASLTATYRDAFIMVKEGIKTNPLVFYRIGHDVIITKKYFHYAPVASFIILKEFFAESSSERISLSYDYNNFRLILIDDENDDVNNKVWNTTDIFLQLNTEIMNQKNSTEDFIHNKFINMTMSLPEHIELFIGADNSSANFSINPIEVLTFLGVKPADFQIGIYKYDKSFSSMVFCAKNYSVVVRNWCGSDNNRPKYIAFLISYYMEPVMIKHLDKLDCSKVNRRIVVAHLEDMFSRAQKRMDLIEKIGFSDTSRAMKCLGIFFAQHVDRENIYRIFGFSSLIEQHQYMVNNCNELLAKDYIDSVTHQEMYEMLNDTIKLFKFSDDIPSRHEQIIMTTILTEFKRFHHLCWIQFKNSFYANHQYVTFTRFDVKNIIRWQRFRDTLFTECARYSASNNQTILLDSIIDSRDFHNAYN